MQQGDDTSSEIETRSASNPYSNSPNIVAETVSGSIEGDHPRIVEVSHEWRKEGSERRRTMHED
jgi:hypothetical protein